MCNRCKRELVTDADYNYPIKLLNKHYCYRCAKKINEGDLSHNE